MDPTYLHKIKNQAKLLRLSMLFSGVILPFGIAFYLVAKFINNFDEPELFAISVTIGLIFILTITLYVAKSIEQRFHNHFLKCLVSDINSNNNIDAVFHEYHPYVSQYISVHGKNGKAIRLTYHPPTIIWETNYDFVGYLVKDSLTGTWRLNSDFEELEIDT